MQSLSAAAGVSMWAKNIVLYWEVIQVIVPKRKLVADSEAKLAKANNKLAIIMEIVNKLKAQLNEIQVKFDAAMAEKKAAEDEAKYFLDRLDLAKRLIAALGSENERWGNIIISIDKDINVIVGDVLIASAFISYIGPFSKQMRDILIKEKFVNFMKELKIPMSDISDPVAMMTDDATKAL